MGSAELGAEVVTRFVGFAVTRFVGFAVGGAVVTRSVGLAVTRFVGLGVRGVPGAATQDPEAHTPVAAPSMLQTDPSLTWLRGSPLPLKTHPFNLLHPPSTKHDCLQSLFE